MMELDHHMFKKIKAEPVDEEDTKNGIIAQNTPLMNRADDDQVVNEVEVVLLRPFENATLSRLVFGQKQVQNMEFCVGRFKEQVRHLELSYQAPRNNDGEPIDERTALYDGIYNGENLDRDETLLRHAVGFFKSGRFYIMPLKDSYEMHRQTMKKKAEDHVERSKFDDSKLVAEMESTSPEVNPVRVAFGRNETEWQKKRREQSAQYKQQVVDRDSWIDLDVNKSSIRDLFEDQIKESREHKSAMMNVDGEHTLPVL